MKQLFAFVLALSAVVAVYSSTAKASEERAVRQVTQAGSACPALPPPVGNIVNVSTEAALWDAVNGSPPHTTILLADGVYHLGQTGHYLWFDTPNVTLRSASGKRDAVILDDNYSATEIVTIAASNVTIADLTIMRAGTHPIHVMSSSTAHTVNTLIYNVHIADPGQQAIKINPVPGGYYADAGVIACSHIELTDVGRVQVENINGSCYTGGLDAHQAHNWIVRDNLIEGFWCSGSLSEHGIHFWNNSSGTLVERNQIVACARGIGLGLGSSAHSGGIIRNNFVVVNQDVGIGLESSPGTRVYNNTVYNTNNFPASIEYRFAATSGVSLINNLTNRAILQRDGGSGTVQNNLATAQAGWFVNAAAGDLHLASGIASVVNQGQPLAEVPDDFDGDPRPIGPAYDIGADEYGLPAPLAVTDLHVTDAATSIDAVTVTLRWTAPSNAATTTLRYSRTLITADSWPGAALLTDTLSGSAAIYTATLSYTDGTLYFALNTQNAEGAWSGLSNLAFWPDYGVYLPVVRR